MDSLTNPLKTNEHNAAKTSFVDNEVISDSSSNGRTIIVEPDESNPNQVVKPTVQPAIDNANPGDTIILKGNFAHCQFTINKKLNIIAYEGTTLGACPHYKQEAPFSVSTNTRPATDRGRSNHGAISIPPYRSTASRV